MNAPSNLTPRQVIWARFYATLHEEVQKLEKLVAQKNIPTDSANLAESESVGIVQRRPRASVSKDSTKR